MEESVGRRRLPRHRPPLLTRNSRCEVISIPLDRHCCFGTSGNAQLRRTLHWKHALLLAKFALLFCCQPARGQFLRSAVDMFSFLESSQQQQCDVLTPLSAQLQETFAEMIRVQLPSTSQAFDGVLRLSQVLDLGNANILIDGIMKLQPALANAGLIFRVGSTITWVHGSKLENGHMQANQSSHDSASVEQYDQLWWKPLLVSFSQIGFNDSLTKVYLQRPCTSYAQVRSVQLASTTLPSASRNASLVFLLTKSFTNYRSVSGIAYAQVQASSLYIDRCDESTQTAFRGTHQCNTSISKCASDPFAASNAGELRPHAYKCCCLSSHSRCLSAAQLRLQSLADFCAASVIVEESVLSKCLLSVNLMVMVLCMALVFIIMTQRKIQTVGSRGWALMELCVCGAIMLYGIIVLEFVPAQTTSCVFMVWFRELGFAMFYGAITLKIYRNLTEYRVRKAHHVFVKEKDLMKYMIAIVIFTLTGLFAWTLSVLNADTVNRTSASQDAMSDGSNADLSSDSSDLSLQTSADPLSATSAASSFGASSSCERHSIIVQRSNLISIVTELPYSVCVITWWTYLWHIYEVAFLLYSLYLCNKAKNTVWWEKKQFTLSIFIELVVTIIANTARYTTWHNVHPQYLLLLSFLHVHFTVTVSLIIIIIPKFRYAGSTQNRTPSTIGGSKAHPSLAKLRDGLANGTIDFAQIPVAEMDPEDIKAELKRVYTQLRMFRIKSIYDENPHIGKRKGAKKVSSSKQQQTQSTNRRLSGFSMPSLGRCSRETKREEEALSTVRVSEPEEEEPSICSNPNADLTVQSSPHNLYIARTAIPGITVTSATARRVQLDNDTCYRI